MILYLFFMGILITALVTLWIIGFVKLVEILEWSPDWLQRIVVVTYCMLTMMVLGWIAVNLGGV